MQILKRLQQLVHLWRSTLTNSGAATLQQHIDRLIAVAATAAVVVVQPPSLALGWSAVRQANGCWRVLCSCQ
jgi:hypothetical protein